MLPQACSCDLSVGLRPDDAQILRFHHIVIYCWTSTQYSVSRIESAKVMSQLTTKSTDIFLLHQLSNSSETKGFSQAPKSA